MDIAQSRLTALALTVVVVAAVPGCGGSKGLSRTELIAKADPICRRANTAVDSAKFNLQNLAQLAPGIAAAQLRASTELAKLNPPASMSADWKVIVDGLRRSGTGIRKAGEVAKSTGSNVKAMTASKTFNEGASEFTRGREVSEHTAGRNGFIDCSTF